MDPEQDSRDAQARAQIQKISQSNALRGSEVLRQLLAYLAEVSLAGGADELKEYTVGIDGLGRPASFDPRQESAVRTQVGRLRQKLAEYNRTEGTEDPIIVDLPKGGFRITFEPRTDLAQTPPAAPAQNPAPAPDGATARRRGLTRREIFLAAGLVLALAAAIYFASRSRRDNALSNTLANGDVPLSLTPELQEIWAPLFSSNRPLIVCISTPMGATVPGSGFVRDPAANDIDDIPRSSLMNALKDALRAPKLYPSYDYASVGTAGAAFLMGQFLVEHDRSSSLTRANLLSLPELANEEVILLGPLTGTRASRALQIDQEIILERGGIRILHPRPGEPAFIAEDAQPAGDEGETHAVISRLPGVQGHGVILSLSGNQVASVMAGAQAVTDPLAARMLVAHLRSASGSVPKYFQVVLKVRAMDGVPMGISYILHRDITAAAEVAPSHK